MPDHARMTPSLADIALPLLSSTALIHRRPTPGTQLALHMCFLKATVLVVIWLYPLSLADLALGTYSTAEIILTLAGFAAYGNNEGWHIPQRLPSSTSLVATIGRTRTANHDAPHPPSVPRLTRHP